MKKRAFTLIELLVVIAIVAILLSILFPALKKAKNYAKRLVCASNLKSIGLSNSVYADENDGWFVPIMDRRGGVNRYWPGNDTFKELIGHRDAQSQGQNWNAPKKFLCPADEISNKKILDTQWDSWLSYAGNITDWYQNWNNIVYAGHKDIMMKNPSGELVFSESNDWWMWWLGADYENGWDVLGHDTITPYKNVGCDGPTLYRHSEGVNITFYDGHVEWMKKEKVFVIADWDNAHPGIWSVFGSYPPPTDVLSMP